MINKHKSNKIKENSNTVRHLNNGTVHRHSKSCCDQSSPARRTITYNRFKKFGPHCKIISLYYFSSLGRAGGWGVGGWVGCVGGGWEGVWVGGPLEWLVHGHRSCYFMSSTSWLSGKAPAVAGNSSVSCQKGPYAWQVGPFWQDTLEFCQSEDH